MNRARNIPGLALLRRRAVARLRKSPQAISQAPVDDVRGLVHELRVHQAELEMQNEELRRVQLDLENSRDRFARLYDLAPIGYLTLDVKGVIHETNLAAARLLGLDRQALLKEKLSQFIEAESQDDFYLHCQQVFAAKDQQSCELKMHRVDGSRFSGWLEAVAETLEANEPRQCLVAIIDVTERRQAELARSRLAAIVDSSEDAIVSRDLEDIITTWNVGAEKLLGYAASEIVGRSFTVLVPPDHLEEVHQIRRRIELGEPVAHYDAVRIAKNGRHIPVSTTSSAVKDAVGKLVGFSTILRDTTRRMELEKEILAIGERVQRQIGQDLHDDLCQQLTSIEFLARSLERQLAASPAQAARAKEVSQLTRQAITHTRELAHGMSPLELETDGLTEALGNLAARVKKLFRIDCRFRCDSQAPVDEPEARICFYRIAQEAINNALKHGKARRIEVRLVIKRNSIALIVQDNGLGLPANLRSKGFGLRVMEHRASTLGGTLSVRKRRPGGTILLCSIPRNRSGTPAEARR